MFRSHIVHVLNSQSTGRMPSEDRTFSVSVVTHEVAAGQVKGVWEADNILGGERNVFPMCFTDQGLFRLQSLHKTMAKKS